MIDGEFYGNPFLAMIDRGKEWATDGMSVEEMTAAAEHIGGTTLNDQASVNLTGLAQEEWTRINQPDNIQGVI